MEERLNDQEKQLKRFKDKSDDSQEIKLPKIIGLINKRLNNVLEHQPSKVSGKLLWCIKDYEQRLLDAKAGCEVLINSDTFYSGSYGYKFECCVALNGEGDAHGSHASIFIKVLQGAYDALLPWPYSGKIVFTLINQTKVNSDIVMKGMTPEGEDEFQRPKAEHNVGIGYTKFAKHKLISTRGFLKDDVIFIKVEVEPFNLFKKKK